LGGRLMGVPKCDYDPLDELELEEFEEDDEEEDDDLGGGLVRVPMEPSACCCD